MPTCRDIITRALRKAGHIGRNENPSDADEAMGMNALQSMFDGWISGGTFGPMHDLYRDAAYTARAGQRIRTTFPVTLPDYTQVDSSGYCDDYGFGHRRDGRPQNRAVIVVVNPSTGERQSNLWDAWVGGWVRIEALQPGDEAPLAALGANGLACCVARAVADETGLKLNDETVREARAFVARIQQGADGRRDATPGVYC